MLSPKWRSLFVGRHVLTHEFNLAQITGFLASVLLGEEKELVERRSQSIGGGESLLLKLHGRPAWLTHHLTSFPLRGWVVGTRVRILSSACSRLDPVDFYDWPMPLLPNPLREVLSLSSAEMVCMVQFHDRGSSSPAGEPPRIAPPLVRDD